MENCGPSVISFKYVCEAEGFIACGLRFQEASISPTRIQIEIDV